jgi:hypothetical protein
MAPRDTRSEAFQAGQENPYIGSVGPLQRLYGTLGAIGEELGGSDMGTPVGTKFKARQSQTKADIKRLQELREKHPEEFGRGQMMAQQQADPYELGLGLGTLGMMTPYGRTTFDMAGGGETPEGIFRNPELGFRPRGRGPGPEGAPINAGFDVPRGMNRFEANQYYMTHGIPGDEIYYRSNPPMPYPTSRNAFEEASVLAANKTRPSPAPANYDYMGPSVPGPVSQRPMSDFDRASMGANWSGQGKGQYGRFVPGQRTGTFREGDFPPYSPEEMGQAIEPYRAQTQVQPQGTGGANYPYRPGPVGFQLLPPYERGGLPTMARGGEIPYGEFRDVTGNVLMGPEGRGAIGYNPGAMMGQRMGQGAYQYEPVGMPPRGGFPLSAAELLKTAQIAGPIGGLAEFARLNYNRPGVSAGPYDFGMMPGPQGMEAMQNLPAAPQGIMAAPSGGGKSASRGGGKKAAGVPMPTRRPAEISQPQGQFEGNFNYDVTRAIDALLGRNEAERGRQYQEYYANNPWPY